MSEPKRCGTCGAKRNARLSYPGGIEPVYCCDTFHDAPEDSEPLVIAGVRIGYTRKVTSTPCNPKDDTGDTTERLADKRLQLIVQDAIIKWQATHAPVSDLGIVIRRNLVAHGVGFVDEAVEAERERMRPIDRRTWTAMREARDHAVADALVEAYSLAAETRVAEVADAQREERERNADAVRRWCSVGNEDDPEDLRAAHAIIGETMAAAIQAQQGPQPHGSDGP